MKQIRLMFTLLMLVIGWSSAIGEEVINGISYTLGGDTAIVGRCRGLSGSVVIPATVTDATGKTYAVTKISNYAFASCPSITSVTIGDNVRMIDYNAFNYTSITSFFLPAGVLKVDYPLFTGCEQLTSITVDPANPNYDSRQNCNAIIEKKGNALLAGCPATTIPDDVEELKYNSLSFKGITRITIPASVKRIQPSAFAGSGLTSIVIPATTTAIFDNPFRDCADLTSIVVEEGNPVYTSRGCNGIFDYRGRVLVTCPTTKIPEDITRTAEYAFASRQDLTQFEVPSQMEFIGYGAFAYCDNLTEISFGDNVEILEGNTFYWCSNLKTVKLGSNVTSIGQTAFGYCQKLTDIWISTATPPQLESSAFYGLQDPSSITLHVPAAAVSDYSVAPTWKQLNIVPADAQVDGETYTFSGVNPFNTGSNHKYADLLTEEGRSWYGVFRNCPVNDPFSFGTFDGENCLILGHSQNIAMGGCFIENTNFGISGVIKKVIVRAASNLNVMTCSIDTVASRTDNSITYDEVEYGFVEPKNAGWQDYVFTFKGAEYTDAKIQIGFDGPSPVYIHSITIVHDDGIVGPATSGTSGDVTWEAIDMGQTVGMYDNTGQMVQKKLYQLVFTGNGSTGDYECEWDPSIQDYKHTAPWTKLGIIDNVVVGEGVTRLGYHLLDEHHSMTQITLPSTLRTIDYFALGNCNSLKQITLPDGLQTIGSYGLGFCSSIAEIHLPASLTSLSSYSFQGTWFRKITIDAANPQFYSPEGSQVIMKKGTTEVFFGSPYAVLPANTTAIGDAAFYNSPIKNTIDIPEGIITIGARAFYYCNMLTEIKLPASVTTLGTCCFGYCNKLEKFTIGKGVTSIGTEMFFTTTRNNVNTSVLADVYCYANPSTLTWSDYSSTKHFMANKATKFHVPANYLATWQEKFPDINATYVGDLEDEDPTSGYSFAVGGIAVTSANSANIQVPGLLAGIISYDPTAKVLTLNGINLNAAGQNWSSLINFQNTAAARYAGPAGSGDGTAAGQDYINIRLEGDNVIQNTDVAFAAPSVLFTGEGSLTVYGRKYAVKTSIDYPLTVEFCKLNLFSSEGPAICTGYLEVKNGGYISMHAPAGCTAGDIAGITDATTNTLVCLGLEDGAEILTAGVNGWKYFSLNDGLPFQDGHPTFANNVTIGTPVVATEGGLRYSFDIVTREATVCENLAAPYSGEIAVPATVSHDSRIYDVVAIDDYAFNESSKQSGDARLTAITLPGTLRFIGNSAFASCSQLAAIHIPDSVTTIASGAFSSCTALEKITVGALNRVYDSRENCNAVIRTAANEVWVGCRATTFPQSVTAIGRASFIGHSDMRTIDLPENITVIGFNTFTACDQATSVTLRGQVTEIGDYSFSYLDALKEFTCYAVTPPAAKAGDENCFDYATIANATLYVPAESVERYASIEPWSKFGQIVAIGTVTLVDPELAFNRTTVQASYGQLPIAPTLKNKWRVETKWSSSNEAVATVDQEGHLTLTGIGQTEIKAVSAADDVYSAGTAAYTLTVVKGKPELRFPVKVVTTVMGSTDTEWPLATIVPEELSFRYCTCDSSVVIVDDVTGEGMPQDIGNTYVKAIFDGNDYYEAAEASYTVSVTRPEARQPQLDFSQHHVKATLGESFIAPQIINPEGLVLSWSSDNTDAVDVTANGEAILKGVGKAIVSATWAGNDTWTPAVADYEVEVRIVESIDETKSVSFDSAESGIDENTDLDNTTVGGVLYTLDATNGDGYDAEDQSISITSTLDGQQMEAIISTTEPGSEEFAAAFKGMSFLLTRGRGSVDVDFFTIGDHQLSVKLGDKAAATFTKNERGTITIDYEIFEDTWVYIYATMKDATASVRASHRAAARRYQNWLSSPAAASAMFRAPAVEEESRLKIYAFEVTPIEVVTGISEVAAEGTASTTAVSHSSKGVYSLSGQRVITPKQGIYIVGGRKIVK